MHTYMHTYTHTYIHTCVHTCMHTRLHTHIHTYIHAYMPTHIHAYTRTHTHPSHTPALVRPPCLPLVKHAPISRGAARAAGMPAVCARHLHAQRWARRAATRAGLLVRAASPGQRHVCELAAAPTTRTPTTTPTLAGGAAPACICVLGCAPARANACERTHAGAPMRVGRGHYGGRHLVGLCALCDIAIVRHAAATHLRAHALDRRRVPACAMCARRSGLRGRAAHLRRAVVRRVRGQRFRHQRLPVGLLEDRPRRGVPKCGRRTRQRVQRCDLFLHVAG